MLQILTLTNHKVFCTIQNINIERLHMNTLNISSELAHEIILSKYNLPDNFRIVIDPPPHVEENKSDEWIYVPNNWYNRYMPPEATKFKNILVEYVSGTVCVSSPADWDSSWDQTFAEHIVRFRPVNKDE